MATYDVFISYPHAVKERVRPIKHALETAGARVWFDEAEVANFEGITRVLDDGITHSKVLLAFFEREHYPNSRACQWELTTAFIAAQHQGDPRDRVLVVNPSRGADHILPGELRDALFPQVPEASDDRGLRDLAEGILARARTVSGAFGSIRPLAQPRWFGYQGFGSNRFVGRRRQMWELHSALNADLTVAITGQTGPARVQGLGGVGKSLLAEEYALRFAPAYPGGVFWLRAYGNDDTKEPLSPEQREAERDGQLRSFAAALDLDTAGRSGEEVRTALAGKIEQRAERCLWVVNDLPAGLSRDEFGRWLAPHPLARTLITTRTREHEALGTTIALGVLSEEEAYRLLCRQLTPAGADEVAAARGLLADVGFHPLAVDVLGALLGSPASPWGFAAFRTKLRNRSRDALKLAQRLRESLPNRTEKYVATVLQHSIEQLSEEGRDVLRLASVLATAPIPATLVGDAFAGVDGLGEEEAEEVVFGALEEVLNLSLAEGAAAGGVEVHTLVSRATHFTDSDTERTTALKQAAILALTEAFEQAADPGSWPLLERLLPHGRELAGNAGEVAEVALLGRVAAFEYERGSYGVAAADHRLEVSASQRLLGEEHPTTLIAMGNLAKAHYALGDLEAAKALNEQTLDARRRVLGEEHPETLDAMNNLALTIRNLGDLERSRELNQRTLDARLALFGEEHADTLTSMNNLAVTLHALGDLEGARDLNRRTLDAQRRARGEEHPYTLSSMHNLAGTLYALGDLEGARDLNRRTLDGRQRVLGEEHPYTLSSVTNLAVTLYALGDLEGARDLTWRSLDAKRRILGAHHADTTTSAWNLFKILQKLGEPAEAAVLLESDLAWLLDRDAESLSMDHRGIQDMLREVASGGEDG